MLQCDIHGNVRDLFHNGNGFFEFGIDYLEKVNQSKVAIYSSTVAEMIKPCNSTFMKMTIFFIFLLLVWFCTDQSLHVNLQRCSTCKRNLVTNMTCTLALTVSNECFLLSWIFHFFEIQGLNWSAQRWRYAHINNTYLHASCPVHPAVNICQCHHSTTLLYHTICIPQINIKKNC